MEILFINFACGIGSTGYISMNLIQQFEKQGRTVKIAYGHDSFVPEKFKKYAVENKLENLIKNEGETK